MRYEIVYWVVMYCGLFPIHYIYSYEVQNSWSLVFKLHARYQKALDLVGYLGQPWHISNTRCASDAKLKRTKLNHDYSIFRREPVLGISLAVVCQCVCAWLPKNVYRGLQLSAHTCSYYKLAQIWHIFPSKFSLPAWTLTWLCYLLFSACIPWPCFTIII